MSNSKLSYSIRRATDIIRANPEKILMALTLSGWKKFFGLSREKAAWYDEAAAAKYQEQISAKRAEFQTEAWRHDKAYSVRNYQTYETYVAHQRDKLEALQDKPFAAPEKAIEMFRRRFELATELPAHATVLCLGARRGEEVRALIGLGHFAIGIDLNPGANNALVLPGDFHALNFADSSVDCVYTNCLDHAFEIEKILREVHRVLKNGGIFLVDIVDGHAEGYAAGNHDSMHWAKAQDFASFMANAAGLQIVSFRSLSEHGSPQWNQCVMKKP